MFSVAGWNVDASQLKQQTAVFSQTQKKAVEDKDLAKASRKRKRDEPENSKPAKPEVKAKTDTHKDKPAQAEPPKRDKSIKARYNKKDKPAKADAHQQDKSAKADAKDKADHSKLATKDKSKGKEPPKAVQKHDLTPMQSAMRQKLISARFRHLNEKLYTSPSQSAQDLFNDASMFEDYHAGFRQQVAVWPENPVDKMITSLRTKQLPRPCTVADLGCGDARIVQTLTSANDLQRLKMKVHSFDLHSSKFVTKADIANVPLANESVNVAIFCLALMGTNWPAFIDEAYRILHWKGELWIAEIKSRFARPRIVDHSVGRRQKDEIRAEVDAPRNEDTNIQPFVDALTRRGFVLKEGGVDMSNKMFVSLEFVKAAKPSGEVVDNEAKTLKPCLYKVR